MREKIAYFVILLIAATLSATEFNYVLTKGGDSYGSCKVDVARRGSGYFIKANAKAEEGGAARTVDEQITLDGDWLPTDYSLSVSSPEGDTRITAKFGEEGAKVEGKLGMGEFQTVVESAVPLSVWSENIGLASLLALLERADFSAGGKSEFAVLLPNKVKTATVTLSVTGQEDAAAEIHGERDGGWAFDATYDPKNGVLSELTVAGGFKAVLSKEKKAEAAPQKPTGGHPLTKMMLSDKDFVERTRKTKKLEGSLAMNIPEGAFERLYLNHFSQEFAGEISKDKAVGSIEVKMIGHKVTNAPDWPLYYPLEGFDEEYALPERDIDSDDPAIIERAKKIVRPAKTLWDAARGINLWVYRNVEYDEQRSAGAKETFTTLKGDSRSKALLSVALCRAAGIPARIVSGVLWADGATDHTWVEVYLGEKVGWGPIDPTLGEADKIDAAHISLWLGTQAPPVFAKDVILQDVVVED
ncbi:transglutaminase family protein [bacterium]|nr:transglutaminase family protein [bacterium]